MRIFEKQGWHVAALLLLGLIVFFIARLPPMQQGQFWGLSTPIWLALAVAEAVLHQVWVWLCWRLELHYGSLSTAFGSAGFPLYGIGFGILFLSRPVLLVILAYSNRNTLAISSTLGQSLALLFTLPALYVLYSIARYFSFRRALGADHFEPEYRNRGLETRGSFGLIRNSMYLVGLLILWVPALLWRSSAALLAAAFQHSYIWVHYYTVELPDMQHIYGDLKAEKK